MVAALRAYGLSDLADTFNTPLETYLVGCSFTYFRHGFYFNTPLEMHFVATAGLVFWISQRLSILRWRCTNKVKGLCSSVSRLCFNTPLEMP